MDMYSSLGLSQIHSDYHEVAQLKHVALNYHKSNYSSLLTQHNTATLVSAQKCPDFESGVGRILLIFSENMPEIAKI
jgi:hypothetical protein